MTARGKCCGIKEFYLFLWKLPLFRGHAARRAAEGAVFKKGGRLVYCHLGRDYVVNTRDVLGIFNLETTTVSPRGRAFLENVQKNGAVVSVSEALPKSYVLTDEPVETVYLSDLSPAVMERRFARGAAAF